MKKGPRGFPALCWTCSNPAAKTVIFVALNLCYQLHLGRGSKHQRRGVCLPLIRPRLSLWQQESWWCSKLTSTQKLLCCLDWQILHDEDGLHGSNLHVVTQQFSSILVVELKINRTYWVNWEKQCNHTVHTVTKSQLYDEVDLCRTISTGRTGSYLVLCYFWLSAGRLNNVLPLR